MKRSGIEIMVFGKVQGVFFRKFTLEAAQQLGLKGFVTNRADGSVYINAFGEVEMLHQLVQKCKSGSPSARVSRIVSNEIPYQNLNAFEIHR